MPRSVPVALLALVLVGCGGGGNGRKDPEGLLLRKAAAAMRQVRSLHLEGTGTTATGRFTFAADVARDGKLRYSLRLNGQRLTMVQAGDDVYMRANAAFWRANGVIAAVRLEGRWIKAPAEGVRSVAGR